MNETEPLGAVFLIPDSVIADEHSAEPAQQYLREV
jgi:hypothetical protein